MYQLGKNIYMHFLSVFVYFGSHVSGVSTALKCKNGSNLTYAAQIKGPLCRFSTLSLAIQIRDIVCSCCRCSLCLWDAAAKFVVLPATAPSFDKYSSVVGTRKNYRLISAWFSNFRQVLI